MLSEASRLEIKSILRYYPERQAALLPALHIIQRENGWISENDMESIASFLDISPLTVRETVSFYTMFNRTPVGRYHIQVCTNLSCSLLNSRHIVTYLMKKLSINIGETTGDGQFTLSEVECLGYCGTAPVMMINDQIYENLTEAGVDEILSNLK